MKTKKYMTFLLITIILASVFSVTANAESVSIEDIPYMNIGLIDSIPDIPTEDKTPASNECCKIEIVFTGFSNSMLPENIVSAKNTSSLHGDVDGDNVLTSSDALDALRMSADKAPLSSNADIDNDGVITSSDALEILRRSNI